jgi:hypothetical protein
MSTTKDEVQSPGRLIYQLVVEAQQDATDRRGDVRFAFFRPVTIYTANGSVLAAFSREISESGIGLVHNRALPVGEVELQISHEQGYFIRVRTRILWCQECGQGWFITGGKFVGAATMAP